MSRLRLWIVAGLALQPALIAAAAAPIVVTQVGRAFSAREVRIKRGEVVRFSNADEFIHHIYIRSSDFNFTSSEQEPGTNLDVRFPVPGKFDVRCEIHPKMLLTAWVD